MQLIGTPGSGTVIEQDFDMSDFNAVAISNAFRATVEQGDDFAVTVSADDNIMPDVIVEVVGSELRVELPRGKNFRNATLRVAITMPELTGATLSGASMASISSFPSVDDFSVTVSGASVLEGNVQADSVDIGVSGAGRYEGDVQARTVAIDLSGASAVTLAGSAQELDLMANGASRLNLGALTAERVNVRLAGASNADILVTDTLDVSASGASHVTYTGGGTVRSSNSSGGSSVRAK